MAQEILDPPKTLQSAEDRISFSGDHPQSESSSSAADPSLSRSISSSRLNAGAPAFVPKSNPGSGRAKIHHGSPNHHHQQHQQVIHVFHPPPAPAYDYYGGSGGFVESEAVQVAADPDPLPTPAKDGLSDDVIQKITKQVEYYFSDANLATTEHLMRFISKDPEGFVPISVIGSFKKIKALVHNNTLLATALRTSTKLVVNEDGKKVRRQQPFTESDVEELQSRIVVAENLPEDHCYQSLMKVFSVAGSVRTIRTCYPQTPNGTTSATNRSSKIDMLFSNKLHAFVEYETVEDAEKAVAELNDERNWRSGLRVRLLHSCMVQSKHAAGRGRKPGNEGDGTGEEDEDVSTTNQPKVKQVEEPSQATETSLENVGDDVLNDKEGGAGKRGRGRGRGGAKGRGRGQYHHNNNNNSNNNNNNSNNHHHHRSGGHAIGTPPSSYLSHGEQPVSKHPPGPRMPDGTRGFTMGRGRSVPTPSTSG